MKNLDLPESYDEKKLKTAMEYLHKKAVTRSKGQKMTLCTNAECFEDSFIGFSDMNGDFILLYNWNIGCYTFAVMGSFDISKKEDEKYYEY